MNPKRESLKGTAFAVVVLIFVSASLHTGASAKMPGETIEQKDAQPNDLFLEELFQLSWQGWSS